nr:hypothetical protein BaRGS_005198 [Batillaria attramentaria]
MHLYLAGNNHLLTDVRLTDTDCLLVSKLLQNTPFITSIDLRYNHIGNEGAKVIAAMLKVNKGLQELHLQKYDMRDYGMTRLSETLVENSKLTYLDLSCNRITRDGVKELAKVLKLNTPLETLDLGYNRLEDDGAMHLAEVLGTFNNTLKWSVMLVH